MYGRAKIKGHPIHPALVAFPIAFYVATLAALIVFDANSDPFWYHLGAWTSLAAVVMGAVAALPGVVDLFSIPRSTRARMVALAHGGLNVVTLVLFVIATVIMWRDWSAPTGLLDGRGPLVLAAIGTASLLGAGALGWTLVQTYHVGLVENEVLIAEAPIMPPPVARPPMGEPRPRVH